MISSKQQSIVSYLDKMGRHDDADFLRNHFKLYNSSQPNLASLQMFIELSKMGYLDEDKVKAAATDLYDYYMAGRKLE